MTNYDNEYNRKIKAQMFDLDKSYVRNDMKNYSMLTGEGVSGGGVSGGCSTAGVCDCKGAGLSAGVMKYPKNGSGVSGGASKVGLTSNAVVREEKKIRGGMKNLLGKDGHGTYKGGAIQTSKMNEVKAYNDKLNTEGSIGAGKKGNRAEIVRKVMKDKGLSMIEASKYVKANKLY
jgi:hypothetical protein